MMSVVLISECATVGINNRWLHFVIHAAVQADDARIALRGRRLCGNNWEWWEVRNRAACSDGTRVGMTHGAASTSHLHA